MTAYIKLSTLEYPRHVGDIEIDDDKNYALVKQTEPPEIDFQTQTYYEDFPVQVGDTWKMSWIVRDLTQEEIDMANQIIGQDNARR